ncbi:hypothetical protein C8F04DRAFT_1358364 [Mycena alexandri]|uniref:Uncharacterized protein n=1 Tax=Mycena alexandri TaxID=1745969 RepID=A0AAD6SR60_9AGAR|nr:hypothetical protein C8F04DRAFT_1358364 [Mycena alexandri]
MSPQDVAVPHTTSTWYLCPPQVPPTTDIWYHCPLKTSLSPHTTSTWYLCPPQVPPPLISGIIVPHTTSTWYLSPHNVPVPPQQVRVAGITVPLVPHTWYLCPPPRVDRRPWVPQGPRRVVIGRTLALEQYNIPTPQLVASHERAVEYAAEFETLYYQRMESRIHFVRQSVHNLPHLGPETIRVGPPGLHAQWTIERTIGNLGQEIKSHSQPYANLSERGLRRSQPAELFGSIWRGWERGESVEIWPLLDGHVCVSQMAKSLGLHGRKKEKALNKVRMARNGQDGKYEIGEVQYFLRASLRGALALIDFYSQPCPDLLQRSFDTIWSCTFEAEDDLRLVPVGIHRVCGCDGTASVCWAKEVFSGRKAGVGHD